MQADHYAQRAEDSTQQSIEAQHRQTVLSFIIGSRRWRGSKAGPKADP